MKKLLLLLSILLFASTKGLSQDKGYVSVAVGPSIPIADFASKDSNNDSAGLAKTGGVFDISFVYKFGKNFGIAALVRGQSNSLDTDVLVDELSNQLPANVRKDVEAGNWTLAGGMVGGYASFPISGKVSFESRIMLGFYSASSPELEINLTDGMTYAWAKQESGSSTAFAHLVGVGFKFNAGKKICILANLDYMGAEAEFNDVEIRGSDGSLEEATWNQPFQTINVTVGVGYRL